MDWNALLSTIAIIAFILLMMRGCGGMMTGCGMGVHGKHKPRGTPGGPTEHASHDREAR